MNRTLAIAMDAGDGELVREWIAAGELPVLASLAERGSVARLGCAPGVGTEAAWAKVVSGCEAGKSGMYNWRAIVPGTNRLVRAPSATYAKPFWSQLRREPDPERVLLVDVPFAPLVEDDGITQLLGWGQRGAPRHGSWPADLLDRVRAEHGAYPGGIDGNHDGSRRTADGILRTLRRMTEVRTRVIADLLREREWDLCLAAYFETHHGGHAFHRYLDPRSLGHERGLEAHADSLRDVYRSFDDGLGELLEAAGEDVAVIVFSGFGMRPNTNGPAVLNQAMSGLGYHVPRVQSREARRTEAIRKLILRAIPGDLRRALNRRLPEGTSDRHLERLWVESTDWDRTVAVPLIEQNHAYVGLSHPKRADGARLCEEIVGELTRLVDAETGEPAIAEIKIRDEVFDGPNVEALPEIWISWSESRFLHRVRHPDLGVLEEDVTGVNPSEHTEEGFAIAAGPGIRRSTEEVSGHVVDVAPTLLHLRGRPVPEEFDGVPLDLLDPALGPPRREPIEIYDGDPWSAVREAEA